MEERNADEDSGFSLFNISGCASCHVPSLEAQARLLAFRQPEIPTDPSANVFYDVDLALEPSAFPLSGSGGITVPLFADLKRHDMGAGLAEDNAGASAQQNREFTTARLWGIADSAPYLHDGRALTLSAAISQHGGEAQANADAFDALTEADRAALIAFLNTLRTPARPNRGL